MKKLLLISIGLIFSTILSAQTTRDSLELYNQTIKVIEYYESKGYVKGPVSFTYSHAIEKIDRAFNEIATRKDSTVTSEGRIKLQISQYRKKIDDHTFYQREKENRIIDLDAPMMRYDRRIPPRARYTYYNTDTFDMLLDDIVTVVGYDPLSVKPISMRTAEEKELLEERYAPDSTLLSTFTVIYPTTQFIVSKTKDHRTLTPYLVCIRYTKEAKYISTTFLEPDTLWELE